MILKIDKEIYRGPRPDNLFNLRVDYHIDTLIDLEAGFYDLTKCGAMQFPADFGMAYYHIPCSDFVPPSKQCVFKCLDLMRQDRVVYIHCLSGVDRTGFVCAVYRMKVQRWSFEDAVAEWKKIGRHPWYFWWERELKKV